jgi:hypothetical protein
MILDPAGLHRYYGHVVGNGHCVPFVQQAGGVPHTSKWRRGQKVRGSGVEPGTVIATFDGDGRYANAVDGSSHVAVLIAETEDGLLVADQWIGQPVHQRTIRFRGGSGNAVNDGDQFHVIEFV